jgi:CheY-like chemotaxis protein
MKNEARVLIVEDEPVLRRVLASYIEAGGFRVAQAGSLAEADEMLRAQRFDAHVLDLGLPDGDGLALLDRAAPSRVLVITANPNLERLDRAGVRHHLEKPVDLPTLRRTVAALAAS